MKKKTAIFGSAGSIGAQTLEVIQEQHEHFEVEVLTTFENADLLIRQAKIFRPNVVVIGDDNQYQKVFDTLDALDIKVYAGPAALEQVTEMESIDLAMMAIVGFDALKPLLAATDMKISIQYALSYPERFPNKLERLDLSLIGGLNFSKPDMKKIRNLALAFDALKKGGNMPCSRNTANELAVQAFLSKQIGFMQIPAVVEHCMETLPFIQSPVLENYFQTDALSREKAQEYIKKHCNKQ